MDEDRIGSNILLKDPFGRVLCKYKRANVCNVRDIAAVAEFPHEPCLWNNFI